MIADADVDIDARKRVSAAFNNDGTRIVTGAGGDDQLREWDATTGAQIGAAMSGHRREVTGVAFSPDGLYIVSGGQDGAVRLWNALDQRPVGQALPIVQPRDNPFDRIALYPTTVAISPDGQRIVTGLNDGTIRTRPGPAAWSTSLCDTITKPMTAEQSQAWVSPQWTTSACAPSDRAHPATLTLGQPPEKRGAAAQFFLELPA